MADPFPREKLQPSLLDRLRDEVRQGTNLLWEHGASLRVRVNPQCYQSGGPPARQVPSIPRAASHFA